MSGYFGVGIVGVSKTGNAGNLIRTANAFGAHFAFIVASNFRRDIDKYDTAKTASNIPVFEGQRMEDLTLPTGLKLVGVEMCDEAVDLPEFPHPSRAAYVLGAERISLPPVVLERCAHLVKIPTKFSLNVATAGAIVMYDRMRCMGGYGPRPLWPGAPKQNQDEHKHGRPIFRRGIPKPGE